jgi:hypothetical protein
MAETSYRPRRIAEGDHAEGILDQTGEFRDLRAAIEQRPYTALAIAVGLAFTVGALWKLGQSRQPYSRLDA